MAPFTILGVDLGGTKTALALYDEHLVQIATKVVPTNASRGYDAVMESLLGEIRMMMREDTKAIGLGVPGFIDHASGTVVTMPNIPGAEGKTPAAFLGDETGLPVALENDARCFAFAEAILGAGKGHNVVLGITLGTGVGGGIVIDGKIFRGGRGYAGEIGHLLLKPGEPPYPTDDKRGDTEQFLSGTAMGRRCEAAKRPEDYLEGAVCGFMQPQVFREVAWLVTDALHLIDPSVIVFGGSAGRALKPHLPAILSELQSWLLPSVRPPELRIRELPDAALKGAVLIATEGLPLRFSL